MAQAVEEWYKQMPIITRSYLTAAIVTTIGCSLDTWIFSFTCFSSLATANFLEENSFKGRTADFFYMLLFGATVLTGIVLVGGMIPYVSKSFARIIFLSNSLTFMMVYVWSKQNPWMQLEVKYWLEIKANRIKLDAT